MTVPPTLTRVELVDQIERATGLSRSESTAAIGQVLDLICAALWRGEDVRITNFGTFKLLDKPERTGRIFTTMSEVTIPPRRVVTFWPCQKLRDRAAGK